MSQVPRVGEGVWIPGGEPWTEIGAWRVENVIYPLDGSVILDFRADAIGNDPDHQASELEKAGFREVSPIDL